MTQAYPERLGSLRTSQMVENGAPPRASRASTPFRPEVKCIRVFVRERASAR